MTSLGEWQEMDIEPSIKTPDEKKRDLGKLLEERANRSAEPGFFIKGPEYAAPLPPTARSKTDTFLAGLREGVTGDILFGYQPDLTEEQDLSYDFTEDMLPGDKPYAAVWGTVRNKKQGLKLRAAIDAKRERLQMLEQRPGIATLAAVADPAALAIDAVTWGAGAAYTLPGIAYGASRVMKGTRAAEALAQSPRAAEAIKQGYLGAQSGAVSMATQEVFRAEYDALENYDHLGQKMFFGGVIGGVLGGGVSLIGKKGSEEIAGKFSDGHTVSMISAREPIGPPKPAPVDKSGFTMKGQPQAPKRTPEQAKTAAQELEASIKAEAPIRASYYNGLRAQMSIVGESLNKNLPSWLAKPMSLVAAPFRNMSATNRALFSKFGTARMFASGYARTALEFLGTREGLPLLRSAQNRIEDIRNTAASNSVDLYEDYMRANGITPGKFSSEKLAAMKNKPYPEDRFFQDVGTQVMHVGKPTEFTNNTNPIVQAAARRTYENVYKPLGNYLKEAGLIKDGEDIAQALNYLNRLWRNESLLANPEKFQQWLGKYYGEVNDRLRSILPAYHQEQKLAKSAIATANRFEKAADKIEKLEKAVEKDFASKVATIEKDFVDATDAIHEKFNLERDKISTQGEIESVPVAKKELKKEIALARKERDALFADYEKESSRIMVGLRDERARLTAMRKSIMSGGKDSVIRKRVADADKELLVNSPEHRGLSVEQIDEIATSAAKDIDKTTMRQLRRDMVSAEALPFVSKIEDLTIELAALKAEKKAILDIQKAEIDKKIKVSTDSLSSKAKSLSSVTLKKEIVDLKETVALSKVAVKKADAIRKVMEGIQKLDALKSKYSREGFQAWVERRAIEKEQKQLMKFGLPESQAKEAIKKAKAIERKRILEAEPVNEARIIAEELRTDANAALKASEDLIPYEYRSNSTGKPYRTWDPAVNPEYALEQAKKTYYTMIGQEDEVVLNPVLAGLGGAPSMLKPRNLKMSDSYPGIEEWVERDIRKLSNNFANGVGPVVGLTDLMRQMNELPIVQMTVKRINVEKYGAKRALDMPNTMQNYNEIPAVRDTMLREEFRDLAKGKSGKELQELLNDYEAQQKNLTTIEAQIKGIFGNGLNVNSSGFSDVVDLVNSAVSTVTTNNIVISMMSELISPSMQYGLGKWIDKGLKPLLTSPEIRSMTKREARAMNLGINTGLGSIIKNTFSGNPSSLKNSTGGKFIQNLSNRLRNITGSSGMQNMEEITVFSLVKSEFLDVVEKVAGGTATAKELRLLAQRSIGKEDAARIHELWKKYGWEKDGALRGIDPAVLNNLTPAEMSAYNKYQDFINDQLRTVLVRPGVGSLPDAAYGPYGNMFLYLKKWFFAATNDAIVPALQRADAEALQGFMGMFAMGALQSKLRRMYRGEEEPEFTYEGYITDALTNSGILGVYTFGVDLGVASGILSGLGGSRYDPTNGVGSLVLGPGLLGYSSKVLGIMSKMRKIMTDEDREFNYKDWNYFANTAVPLYKWAPVAAIAKPNIKEYFESIGRGGE